MCVGVCVCVHATVFLHVCVCVLVSVWVHEIVCVSVECRPYIRASIPSRSATAARRTQTVAPKKRPATAPDIALRVHVGAVHEQRLRHRHVLSVSGKIERREPAVEQEHGGQTHLFAVFGMIRIGRCLVPACEAAHGHERERRRISVVGA
jgi:hypothetical protein